VIDTGAKAAARAEAARILSLFEAAGARAVETAVLQPAEVLLDLYGEDIRARAYVTADPIRGEMMLRPDFTVPVVQMHMDSGADPARYAYAGEVFRKQDIDPARPTEYLQVGYEVFDGRDAARADAEVFAAVMGALDGLPVTPVVGDIGVLLAGVRGLETTEARKAALIRHLWRPRRFRALLDRFGGRVAMPPARAALLAAEAPLAGLAEVPGLRRRDEIAARIETLRADAAAPPISESQMELIDALFSLRETAPNVLVALNDLTVDLPALGPAVTRLSARLDALAERGVDVDNLQFETSHGRTTMEYYDGFVFAVNADGHPDLPPVATGGRYDMLTGVLGQGRGVPAVGGVIRPEVVRQIRGAA